LRDCLSKWCWLQNNSVDLQPKWDSPLIPKLKWSGQDSTPELTLKLLELAKSDVVATIVHGNGSLKELKKQLRKYKGDVKHLIIFHKDSGDYTD
jgi:hypothetical protein